MSRRSKRIIPFSKHEIESLIVPASGRVEYWDESTPSLSVRVSANGHKSFYWVNRVGGEWKRVKIGQWPAMNAQGAKNEATRLSGLAAQGKDPVPSSKRHSVEWTLGQLFEWFLETHSKPHKRTWKRDERRFDREFSQWSQRRVSTITRSEVQLLHLSIKDESGPNAANEALTFLRHMIKLGKRFEPTRIPGQDPTEGIKRFKTESRERFLDATELPIFLQAIEKLPRQDTRDIFKMLLWTGARRSNVFSMRWDELSLASATWTIPGDKAKSGKQMRIPLSLPAIEILTRRKKDSSSCWVFPGKGASGHYTCPRDAIARLRKLSGLKNIRIHDLRRTLGSWMAVDNPLQVVAKQLGHSSLKSTQVYARLANETLKTALEATTEKMMKTTKKKPIS